MLDGWCSSFEIVELHYYIELHAFHIFSFHCVETGEVTLNGSVLLLGKGQDPLSTEQVTKNSEQKSR